MKLRFALFFLLVTNLTFCYCEKIALLGSPYLSNSSYKFYLITDGMIPQSTVNVNLNTDDNPIELKTFDDFSKNLIESDFAVENSNNYELKVTITKCSQSVNLIRTSEQPMIFISFNKPIYKTGEEINFKVFVLNQKLIPLKDYKKMDIAVFDSNKNAVKIVKDAMGDQFGIFRESLQIADDPYLGNWMIQVLIGDKNVTKSFEVQKYDEGDIEVLIDAPSTVAHSDRRMYMSIYAKNSDDNFVRGTASISLKASFVGQRDAKINKPNFKEVELNSFKTSITLDFSEDLDLRFPTSDMILMFEAKVTEKSSKISKTAQKEIKLIHKGRNTIQVIGKKYFRPTFMYQLKIRVKTLDGKADNSFNQLSMELQYSNDRPSDAKKYNINLNKGETVQYLQPTKDTKKIIVNLEFGGTKLTKEIHVLPTFGVEEFIQVTVVSKSTKVGDQVKLTVNATEEMNELHLVVFGLQGIVYSNKFPGSVDKDIFEVSFELTEEMKPEARGIVFYVRNGVMIYDEFSVLLGFSIDNSLELTADKDAKPNTMTTIGVKTEVGAQVFLTAIDSTSALLKRNYEISRTDIYNELVYYLNKKFPGVSRYQLEKLNAYILEPLINGQNCGSELSSRTNIASDDEEEVRDNEVHQYFPKVYFDDSFNSTSLDIQNKQMQVPNSLSTLKLYGISVHKTKGFTVAKVQPEISVKEELLIQIEVPSLIRTNEIVRAAVSAFNFQNSLQNGKIVVTIENGFFMDEEESKIKKDCLIFSRHNSVDSLTFNEPLPANGKPVTVKFLVSTDQQKPIKIKAKVTANDDTYESEKVIDVLGQYMMEKTNLMSYLIESKGSNKFEKKIDFSSKDLKSNDVYITLHGDLFGAAFSGLEAIFNKSMVLPEEKLLKFAASIIIYKFTELDGFHNEAVNIKAMNDMIKGYQESLPILQKLIKENQESQSWFASFIAGILIDASEFISVDSKVIDDLLDFIKNKLGSKESFDYKKLDDLHRDIDSGAVRKTVQTALITNTLLKRKEKFGGQISKLIKYIKNNSGGSDYVKAIVAYTLTLNGDTSEAKPDYTKTLPKDKSANVELLSYIIQTKILTDSDPKDEVDMLICNHRNADGGFYSPYDTVLGLQALYEYTKYKGISTNHADYEIGRNKGTLNLFESVTFKVSKGDTIKLNRNVLAYASLYFHQKQDKPTKIFTISYNKEKSSDTYTHLEFKFTPPEKNPMQSNQFVLEVEIARGHRFVELAETDATINKFELKKHGTAAVFYINYMEINKKYKLAIRTSKVYDFYATESQIIWLYDYYRPNLRGIAWIVQDNNAKNCQ
ncbi:unnamed protein product [Chironomus riparius]|uniref:Uncharacterized protein n=1 Tax=Chironomus riparius TaxID=315576 RepID=A0A9N9WXM9_9DIPT|nr:unnamed protein product [Chironomus riparius]